MTVSFESKEERDEMAPARVLTPVIVERPKSEIQARRALLIRMLALIREHQRRANTQPETTTHPFQIPVDEVEAMHICQTLCNVGKLKMSVKDPHSTSNVHTSSIRFTSGFF